MSDFMAFLAFYGELYGVREYCMRLYAFIKIKH